MGRSLETIEQRLGANVIEYRGRATNAIVCLLLAHLGQKTGVTEILKRSVIGRPEIGTNQDLVTAYVDALYLEAAVVTENRQAAELLFKRFINTGTLTSGIFYPTVVPRHLGGACALLGRYEEARKYYDEAIKVCTEMRFRPELALSRLQLAELLLEHYPNEKKEAVEHLDFCIPEFRDMEMQPSLERVLRHKEILKA
jgi:tetratricopeptide (TPR) repeat protein